MKTIVLLAIPAALAGCHAAPEGPAASPTQPPQAAAGACALEIRFGSYAMGIDSGALQRVEGLLAARRIPVQRTAWGREGEVTLCATPRTPADAERLAREIAALLPADPRGPIAVATAAGFTFQAGR
ncbi:MAG TPA: hypothetical protein VEZ20_02835 [Allosphingosinicella sp.]|nr:hypothetical protein [Allosphingosinicella sp.]